MVYVPKWEYCDPISLNTCEIIRKMSADVDGGDNDPTPTFMCNVKIFDFEYAYGKCINPAR